jgi:hypothetical protein
LWLVITNEERMYNISLISCFEVVDVDSR